MWRNIKSVTMINLHFNSIIQLLQAFPDEQTCINHLTELRWNGNVISPFDKTSKVYVCKGNKYRCKNTGKYFNVRTNTLFDNTKIELQKWFLAIYLITAHKKGISSLQLHRDINVTQKTAWFMLQRIRNCFGLGSNDKMDTDVEVDETYVGGKESNKHKSKRNNNPQSLNNKATVVGIVQRGSKVLARVVETSQAKHILPILLNNVKPNTVVMTDSSTVYKRINGYYQHGFVNHSIGEYVNGSIHTNTIENFWSLLKRGIFGIYHFASKKHLQKYVDEFVFRYNTSQCTEAYRFNLMLSHPEKRLTYKKLISNGK